MEMARYAIGCAERGDLPADCVSYVKANAERLDGQHLEMAIFLLDKIGSEAARHELVKYVGHPLKHIRLTVIGMLDRMTSVDYYTLAQVRQRFDSVTEKTERRAIKSVLEKAKVSS
jgi:hypothetical protein